MEAKTPLLVKDIDFTEQELKTIDATHRVFSYKYKVEIKTEDESLSNILIKIDKIILKLGSVNPKVLNLRNKIIDILTPYIIDNKTFTILGETNKLSTSDDKYTIIFASTYDEAKQIRDELEAETYTTKNIPITQLLSIINNIQRSHGSSDISPELLKSLIKNL